MDGARSVVGRSEKSNCGSFTTMVGWERAAQVGRPALQPVWRPAVRSGGREIRRTFGLAAGSCPDLLRACGHRACSRPWRGASMPQLFVADLPRVPAPLRAASTRGYFRVAPPGLFGDGMNGGGDGAGASGAGGCERFNSRFPAGMTERKARARTTARRSGGVASHPFHDETVKWMGHGAWSGARRKATADPSLRSG